MVHHYLEEDPKVELRGAKHTAQIARLKKPIIECASIHASVLPACSTPISEVEAADILLQLSKAHT
jgi:hypothetical protein